MSSNPKREDELIPFEEVTSEKTIPGTNATATPPASQPDNRDEVTQVGSEITQVGTAPSPLSGVLDLLTPSSAQATTFPPIHANSETAPPTDAMRVDENPDPTPEPAQANDELTAEVRLPPKAKRDWKHVIEVLRGRAVDWRAMARERTGDLVMKFQLLPPRQKKLAYASAGVFAGVFTLALFLPRLRPSPASRQPRAEARPRVPRPNSPNEVKRSLALPSRPGPPVAVKAPPPPQPPPASKAAAAEKKAAAQKTVAKKTDAKKAKAVASAKKKATGKKKAAAKSGKHTKQAATKKPAKNRKPASK